MTDTGIYVLINLTPLQLREDKHNIKNYKPDGSVEGLVSGTYYLERVDEMNRRYYAVKA